LLNIDHECDLYGPVLETVLQLAKVNQAIWEASMDTYLPKGEEFVRKSTLLALSSPFTYTGNKSKQEMIDIYVEACNFGVSHLKSSTSFAKELADQAIDSDLQQTTLLVLDFLIMDYVYDKFGMQGTEFKSAISAFGIQEEERCQQQIQEVVKVLS
jgi:hypothetical protein